MPWNDGGEPLRCEGAGQSDLTPPARDGSLPPYRYGEDDLRELFRKRVRDLYPK